MDDQLDDVRERVAKYVSYWRAHAGLSIAQAVEATNGGVSRSKWSEIENARGDRPKPETLGAVARALSRDPAELLEVIGLDAPSAADAERRNTARESGFEIEGDTPAKALLDRIVTELVGLRDDVRRMDAAIEQLRDGPETRAEPSSTAPRRATQ